MKTVYFVRHGETESNFRQVPGYHTDPLSTRGQMQAARVADRLIEAEVEIIISSPYIRAHQTAEAINKILQKELILDKVFEEQKGVVALKGIVRTNPEVKRIRQLITDNIKDPDWHYAEEENFFDARARAQAALTSIITRPEDRILIVTHGAFLRMLVRVMMLGDLFTSEIYLKMYWSLILSNTGVTVCQFSSERGWQLVRWNDTVHLTPELYTD